MTLFRVSGLCKRFGRRQVVSGVDLAVEPGEVVGLLGANGAGKTTTFRMVVGLLAADAGSIHLADTDITTWPMAKRARAGIGYLAQEPTIFAQLSVADNLRMVIEEYYPRRQRRAVLETVLSQLDLGHLQASRAGSLSGGEKRRLEITRALITSPRLLFFDEPFAGVDPKSRAGIRDISASLKERGISVLITDHNAEAILAMVDRLYVMEAGGIIASGTPAEIVANHEVRRAYLGDDFVLPGAG